MTTNPENSKTTPQKIKNTKILFILCVALTFITFSPIQIGNLATYTSLIWCIVLGILFIFSIQNWRITKQHADLTHAFSALFIYGVIFALFYFMKK
jgi:hypothetical protein